LLRIVSESVYIHIYYIYIKYTHVIIPNILPSLRLSENLFLDWLLLFAAAAAAAAAADNDDDDNNNNDNDDDLQLLLHYL
jgi:hypothetical protein